MKVANEVPEERLAIVRYEEEAYQLHEDFYCAPVPGRPHYMDFNVRKHKILSGRGNLGSVLGFRKIVLQHPTTQNINDLFEHERAGFLQTLKDTQALSNVHLLFDRRYYGFKQFYKKVLLPLSQEDVKTVLSKTTLVVWVEPSEKEVAIAAYSALLTYFTILVRKDHGANSCFDRGRKLGAELARKAMFGGPGSFLEGVRGHDLNLDELTRTGTLKNSLFRYYLVAIGAPYEETTKTTAGNKLTLTVGKEAAKIKIGKLPLDSSFFIRDASHGSEELTTLTLARFIGSPRNKQTFSFLHTVEDGEVAELKVATIDI